MMQLSKYRSSWKYLWTVPTVYTVVAGIEAVLAGTVVGLMQVRHSETLRRVKLC
jgi:hypothetical protein